MENAIENVEVNSPQHVQPPQLKLRTDKIVWISFGFFATLMFWQIYNYYMPLMLANLLETNVGAGDYEWLIGAIMGADNLVALFVLPLVGILSDRVKSNFGKRMPFIIVGAAITILAFPFIPVLFLINSLAGVIALMAMVLVTMNIVRGPAIALMPDVTPKPLRPKANAIVNFIGYIGAILGGALTIFVTGDHVRGHKLLDDGTIGESVSQQMLYIPFIVSAVVMALCIVLLYIKVKENKLAEEVKADMELGEQQAETEASKVTDRQLTKGDKINLWLLLGGIFFWFFAFNAMETWWSTYGNNELTGNNGLVGTSTIVLAIVSLATFLPAIKLTKKIGRKWSVIVGICIILVAITPMLFVKSMSFLVVGLFGAVGIGWAIINLNSFPMIVEYSSKSTVGKYTGLYYSASQLAQTITPFVAGALVSFSPWGYSALFPYVLIFFAFAFIVMLFFQGKRKNTAAEQVKVYED